MTTALHAAVQALPRVVIDTNSVLDWLLFDDASMASLAAAVQRRAVNWVLCSRMREEFARVLAYPSLATWHPDSQRLLASVDRHASMQADPPALPSLRCSDPDDQVFLDLAVACGARWLVSHDRALLRLAKRAAKSGLVIVRPQHWRMDVNINIDIDIDIDIDSP